MDYCLVNEKNEDVIYLTIMKRGFIEVKKDTKNDLIEVYFKDSYNFYRQFYKQYNNQFFNLFLTKYLRKDFPDFKRLEYRESLSGVYKFSNNLYFKFQYIENEFIRIGIRRSINKLYFDKNSFYQNNSSVLLTMYEDCFTCDNYKEFINVFPTINKSKIQINLYDSTNTKFYFDNILDEIIKNKNFEKAFYLYTLLELYDSGSNIYLLKEGLYSKKIENNLKLFIEKRISKQQLKDICENFETLQRCSIEF